MSKEIFEQAQIVLGHRCHTKTPSKPYQPFRGLLKCAYCGKALTRCICKEPYYYCATRRALPEASCAGVYLGEKELEASLFTALRTQIQLVQDNKEAQQGSQTKACILQGKLQECQKEAEKCKAKQAASFEDYAEGRIQKQEYLSRKKELSGQQEEINRQYADLSEKLSEAMKCKDQETGDLGRYAFASELTREMLEELVREVRVGGKGEIEIVWNFRE